MQRRFRKRPDAIVEAFKWTGCPDQGGEPCWMVDALTNMRAIIVHDDPKRPEMRIRTLEGTMTAQLGDYIVRGLAGEIWPVKSAIFEATYEEVFGA